MALLNDILLNFRQIQISHLSKSLKTKLDEWLKSWHPVSNSIGFGINIVVMYNMYIDPNLDQQITSAERYCQHMSQNQLLAEHK